MFSSSEGGESLFGGTIMPMFWGSCLTFLLLWLWVLYLETAKIPETRTTMIISLLVIQLWELPSSFWLSSWTPYILWGFDYCGMLDAILRFPLVKDVDDMLNMKVIGLLMMKSLVIAFEFKEVDKHPLWFIWMMFYCGWGVPMLYVMALPLSDTATAELERHRESVRDISILEKTWRLCFGADTPDNQQLRHDFLTNAEWAVGLVGRVLRCIPGLRTNGPKLPKWQPRSIPV